MLSTSRKEFFGSPDIHQRAVPGLGLRSHCDRAALLLPHPTHVSTGVNIRECLPEPTTQQALLRCWHGGAKTGPLPSRSSGSGKGKGFQTWSSQSRAIRTILSRKQAPGAEALANFIREKAEEEVAALEKAAESPRTV